MRGLKIAGIGLFGILLAVCGNYIHDFHQGEQKLVKLLNGDETQNIVSFETRYQQRRVRCTDTEILRYFQHAMAKHPKNMTNEGGCSYKSHLRFQGGGTFEGYISTSTNGFDVSIRSQAVEEGFPTHSIPLIQPVSAKVRRLFDFLSEGETAVGKVLIFEDGKPPREEYDGSLVAK